LEDGEDAESPPQPTLARRAKSHSDFYDIVKSQLPISVAGTGKGKRGGGGSRETRAWEALALSGPASKVLLVDEAAVDILNHALEQELLLASQQGFTQVPMDPHPPTAADQGVGSTMSSCP